MVSFLKGCWANGHRLRPMMNFSTQSLDCGMTRGMARALSSGRILHVMPRSPCALISLGSAATGFGFGVKAIEGDAYRHRSTSAEPLPLRRGAGSSCAIPGARENLMRAFCDTEAVRKMVVGFCGTSRGLCGKWWWDFAVHLEVFRTNIN